MCGFLGLVSSADVGREIHLGLQAIQHRGQDSAGIATMEADGKRFHARRGLGTVGHALSESDIAATKGPIGLGHVRYPTVGRGVLDDTQPFFYRQPGVLMAHNGNVTNVDDLSESLMERSIHLLSRCDVEPALCEFSDALMRTRPARHTLEDAVSAARELHARVRGAWSIVAALMLDGVPTLMVLRDAWGIRPAVIGQRADGALIAASESVALDVLGFERIDEPQAGEVVFLRANQAPIRVELTEPRPAPCVFEHIYFARPDSFMAGRSVYEVRFALGRALAERIREKSINADVVVPVPDTSRPAAVALAESLNLPLREGLIKNRYSGRTFIMPDRMTRDQALRLKLNLLPSELTGRRVLLVDDSIVRGATLSRVIAMIQSAGVAELHLAIHAPPVMNPCFYGIDMSTEEELFARRFKGDLEQVELDAAAALGAHTLTWLTVEALDTAFAGPRCAACFDGCYPQPLDEQARHRIAAERRR